MLGGWEIGSIAIVQSGPPFNVVSRGSFQPDRDVNGAIIGFLPTTGVYNADGADFEFPNDPGGAGATSLGSSAYLNAAIFRREDFPLPNPGGLGNPPRGAFRGPGMINIDFTVIKQAQLTDNTDLQFRFEFFNVLNRVNLRDVDGNLISPTFGRVTSTFPSRQIQLGVRLTF